MSDEGAGDDLMRVSNSEFESTTFLRIAHDLSATGVSIVTDFLSFDEVAGLASEASQLRERGLFRPAAVGRDSASTREPQIRGDETLWFDARNLLPLQQMIWKRLDRLKDQLNQTLFLGLWELEGHFAHYEPGSFYRQHIDRFRDNDSRVVSCVLYLNLDWQTGDGGELKIGGGGDARSGESRLISPRGGTLVTFMSADIAHEVLETRVPRLSFAGWFRKRALST